MSTTKIQPEYFEKLYIDILARGLERMRNNKTTIKAFQLYLTQITEIHNLRVEVDERESRWIGTKRNGTANAVNNI